MKRTLSDQPQPDNKMQNIGQPQGRGPARERGARGSEEQCTSDQRHPPKEGRTFRVRGVPLGWESEKLRSLLAEQDNAAGPSVQSLADEIHGRSRTATVSFQNVPSQLQKAGDSWKISPAASNQPADPQSLVMDGDFLGITTLYAPPSQDHKIE